VGGVVGGEKTAQDPVGIAQGSFDWMHTEQAHDAVVLWRRGGPGRTVGARALAEVGLRLEAGFAPRLVLHGVSLVSRPAKALKTGRLGTLNPYTETRRFSI
jgi:hypothetical protein